MPPAPPRPSSKSVTFCSHCKYEKPYKLQKPYNLSDRDLRYYSDPGRDVPKPKTKKKPKELKSDSTDSDLRYYSEPDAKNYFEIDYEFLKELRRIARHNCPKCRRKRSRKDRDYKEKQARKDKNKLKPTRSLVKETYVYCNGRYHSDQEHCQLCCRVCNKSTDTLDSTEDDQYSLVSKSYSLPSSRATTSSRSRSTPKRSTRERKNSTQSIKSVSFLESSNDESRKDEPNYTAKSFTNDLKQFLLKPSPPRLSLRDKFIISFKQEFEATKKSPKLKAIKGLWKSY